MLKLKNKLLWSCRLQKMNKKCQKKELKHMHRIKKGEKEKGTKKETKSKARKVRWTSSYQTEPMRSWTRKC